MPVRNHLQLDFPPSLINGTPLLESFSYVTFGASECARGYHVDAYAEKS